MALTRKTVRIAGDVVTIDELTSRLGYSNPGPILARIEREGIEIVRTWLGLRAVSAQAAHDVYTRMRAEAEELAEQNRAYNVYQEERRLAAENKIREEHRKAQEVYAAKKHDYEAEQEFLSAARAREVQEEADRKKGAPVSFADFKAGKR